MFTKRTSAQPTKLGAATDLPSFARLTAARELVNRIARDIAAKEEERLVTLGVPRALLEQRRDVEARIAAAGPVHWQDKAKGKAVGKLVSERQTIVDAIRAAQSNRSSATTPRQQAVNAVLDGTPAPQISAPPSTAAIDAELVVLRAAGEEAQRRFQAADREHGHALVVAARPQYGEQIVRKFAAVLIDLAHLAQLDREFRNRLNSDGADDGALAALDPLPLGRVFDIREENSLVNRLLAVCETHGATVDRSAFNY